MDPLLVELLAAALKGVVLSALLLAGVRAMRKASAAQRHAVLLLGMIGLAALPLVIFAGPGWNILPPWPRRGVATATAPPNSTGAAIAQMEENAPVAPQFAPPESSPPAPVARTFSSGDLLLAVWLGGALLSMIPPVLGFFRLARLARRCEAPAPDGRIAVLGASLARQMNFRLPIRILLGPRGTMPMAWGFAPKILLPTEASQWPENRLRFVLLHELAHLKRRDYEANLAAWLACAIHWFNPLVWAAARRMAAERERASDDMVLRFGAVPADYAEQILHIASNFHRRSFLAPTAIGMARRLPLEGRLCAVLDETLNRTEPTRGVLAGAATLLAAIAIPIGALQSAADLPAPTVVEKTAPPAAPSIKTEEIAGTWVGGGIVPNILKLYPEGVFEHSHDNESGKWMVQNRQLVRAIEESDVAERVGSRIVRDILELTPTTLRLRNGNETWTYARQRETPRVSRQTPAVPASERPDSGSVAGRVMIAGQPAPGVRVLLIPSDPRDTSRYDNEIITDAAGYFLAANVPAGNYQASRLVMWESKTEHYTTRTGAGSHGVDVEVKPRQVSAVNIGGIGRAVKGRLVPAEPNTPPFAYTAGMYRFLTQIEPRHAGRKGSHIILDIHENGEFSATDVEPGTYELYATVKTADAQLPDQADAAAARETITIPSDPGNAGPLDLGEIRLRPD